MSRIHHLTLREFRCFESLEFEPGPSLNFIIGANARGKSTILEAACLLLRLRSPRTSNPSEMVRFGKNAFALEGMAEGATEPLRLSLTWSPPLRLLKLDGVLQNSSREYLSLLSIVWFGTEDLSLVSGPAERRRKLLDSAGLQMAGGYGHDLKQYERALRSRNLLLREGRPRREIEAYNIPLSETGERIVRARHRLVALLSPLAQEACRNISGETLDLAYIPGTTVPILDALQNSRDEEIRLRQTQVGPHRDDITISLHGIAAGTFASEGQRRTVALALKLALALLLHQENGHPPLLLLDDVFGELDPVRREALLKGIPRHSQAFFSTTDLNGISLPEPSQVHKLENGIIRSTGNAD